MLTSLDQLKATGTIIVSDSGDFSSIGKYGPQDATTNPSLILVASEKEEYMKLMDVAIEYGKDKGQNIDEKTDVTLDRLLKVDARFSFDTNGTVSKALHIIDLYKSVGIDKSRVLIKIASTWEGIQAARILQRDHKINVNLTLMFSMVQAIAGAEAGAFLISPFVGRILDWYQAKTGRTYPKEEDPGVASVKSIYNYYNKFGYNTIVMGASFRNIGEITELAGCDYLTISPHLLEKLMASQNPVPKKLDAVEATSLNLEKKSFIDDESQFRFDFNEEAMAVEKLREGISKFAADADTLKRILKKSL
ncbi:putative transaldolase [Cadophora sp. DSE1049]|nr:putative transaldolase [Cadophora sp. DSE1049]